MKSGRSVREGKSVCRGNYSGGVSVVQCGVAAPFQALIWGELSGALAFEEEDALAEGVVVVVASADWVQKKGKEEEEGESHAKCGNIPREAEDVWRHFCWWWEQFGATVVGSL